MQVVGLSLGPTSRGLFSVMVPCLLVPCAGVMEDVPHASGIANGRYVAYSARFLQIM